ncbi:Dph6-related ATP pyrophosphatase [Runella aurantiaca]|nr:diphthine--ammonia ligase [Runella aurantiaca]
MQTALMNWSGGKDSALALYHSLQNNACDVRYLLTSLNDSFRRISMHGVREELLDQQAQRLGIELLKLRLPETTSMEEYQIRTAEILQPLAAAGITKSIFGDIFLEDLRLYRENQLETVGMQGIFPLWKRPSMELLEEFWGLGFKTIVVSINGNVLDQSFCGRVLDRDFVSELPPNIDPCGENGEFHTFVFEAPYFSQPIDFQQGETVEMTYHFQNTEGEDLTSTYFFTDLLPI